MEWKNGCSHIVAIVQLRKLVQNVEFLLRVELGFFAPVWKQCS